MTVTTTTTASAAKNSTPSYEEITTPSQVRSSLLDRYDTFLLDCDGVLWHDSTPIEGAMETLSMLQNDLKKRLVFVTNSSVRSRRQYCEKFNTIMQQQQQQQQHNVSSTIEELKSASVVMDTEGKHVFSVEERQMFCSAYLAALHLKSHSIGTADGRLVYVVGEDGLAAELRETANVNVLTHSEAMQHLGISNDPNPITLTSEQICKIPDELLERVDAVLVGWDRHFTFAKLSFAAACLLGNPHCKLIATNRDSFDMAGNGRYVPGNGGMVGAIEAVTGRSALVMAKPEPWLVQEIMDEFGIVDKSRMVMVGDRLDTDILLGKNAGIDTLLVMTGCTTRSQLDSDHNDMTPTFVMDALGDIARLHRK